MTSISDPTRLGGVTEVAAELGVTRQQVANLRQRGDFPAPVAALSMGEVWDLDVVRRWADSGLRRTAGRPSQEAAAVALGRRFVLGRPINGGGFGVVYTAVDVMAPLGTQVAVKVLQPNVALDPGTVARFQREMKLMSGLSHPNVMTILATGADEGVGLWYAMPLAVASLDADLPQFAYLQEDQRANAIVAIMRDICAGLDHIHRNHVLHRDLKPGNVLRTPEGAWAIADFGLARSAVETTGLTASDTPIGTYLYAAPEQWANAKYATEVSDIYSAGKILQALLVGGHPAGNDIPPGSLAPVVRRATDDNPDRRYRSPAELLTAIETALAPSQSWETPEEKGQRLRQRLASAIDIDATMEIIKWADEVDTDDSASMRSFALALSAVPAMLVQEWWEANPALFIRVFGVFGRALDYGFPFDDCDWLADFARLAVQVTRDREVLREAVRALAGLGCSHNRWYVRDVAVEILREIRDNADAASALEGLQMAGAHYAQWTAGSAVIGTLHPILRAGIPQISTPPGP